MKSTIEQSYRFCRCESRQAASNFVMSFWLLPREKRRAMYALYSFFRHTDDIGDSDLPVVQRQEMLMQWKHQLLSALAGDSAEDERLPALLDTIERFSISEQYFLDVIAGVQSDLQPQQYTTITDLEQYCYQVASAVGLACLPVWGFDPDKSLNPAIACGYAFQLTNILRDLREDALSDRVYLPQDDLQRFDVDSGQFSSWEPNAAVFDLIQFEVARAEGYYQQAAILQEQLPRDGSKIFSAMFQTYRDLLNQIKQRPEEIFQHRISIGSWKKMKIMTSLVFSSLFDFSERPLQTNRT